MSKAQTTLQSKSVTLKIVLVMRFALLCRTSSLRLMEGVLSGKVAFNMLRNYALDLLSIYRTSYFGFDSMQIANNIVPRPTFNKQFKFTHTHLPSYAFKAVISKKAGEMLINPHSFQVQNSATPESELNSIMFSQSMYHKFELDDERNKLVR